MAQISKVGQIVYSVFNGDYGVEDGEESEIMPCVVKKRKIEGYIIDEEGRGIYLFDISVSPSEVDYVDSSEDYLLFETLDKAQSHLRRTLEVHLANTDPRF